LEISDFLMNFQNLELMKNTENSSPKNGKFARFSRKLVARFPSKRS